MKKLFNSQGIRLLFPLLTFYPWSVPLIIISGLLSSLAEGFGISLFIPFLQSLSLDTATSLENSNQLLQFLNHLFINIPIGKQKILIPLLILGCIIFKNILLYFNSFLFSVLNWRISHQLRKRIFKKILYLEYEILRSQDPGHFLGILNNEVWQTSQAFSFFISLIINFCAAFIFTIFLLLISWKNTLIVLGIIVLISLIIQSLVYQVRTLGKKAAQSNSLFVSQALEALSGLKIIQAFGRETFEEKRFNQVSQQVCDSFMKMDLLTESVRPLSEILFAALLTGILIIALQDSLNIPVLLTFIFILYRLQWPVKQIDGSLANINALTASIESVMNFIHQPKILVKGQSKKLFQKLKKAIKIDVQSFDYPSTQKTVLSHIKFQIPKNTTIGLVGSSGSGKSTLLDLICGFYWPTQGHIYIDDIPLSHLDLKSWRNRIAIVPQETYLFSATVKENIAYGDLEASESSIIQAAKQANAHDFIMNLPQQYDTVIGYHGIQLSGGQKQRLALARALVRKPDVLILDEATNALDSVSEQLIQEALNQIRHQITLIIVAHRLSTVETADTIIVLEKGQIVEKGSCAELLALNGVFNRLYQIQYNIASTN